jgi:hypothetical protein
VVVFIGFIDVRSLSVFSCLSYGQFVVRIDPGADFCINGAGVGQQLHRLNFAAPISPASWKASAALDCRAGVLVKLLVNIEYTDTPAAATSPALGRQPGQQKQSPPLSVR